jgi:predicted negative regulator of RcsB-dependent stress response
MPLESILFLALVIGALIVFAVVLAYADWATRQAMRETAASRPSSVHVRKTPAANPAENAPDHRAAA